jgi:catalase
VSKAFAEHPEWKDTSDPDFMRKRLASELQTGDQCYVFQVQPRADIASDGDIRSQVEDSTNIWDEAQFPFVDVARITIPKQEFDTPEQQTYCENLSFTPWHAVAEQRPLGVMNRIRRVVYETISATRHELNGAPRREPVDMSVPPLAPR